MAQPSIAIGVEHFGRECFVVVAIKNVPDPRWECEGRLTADLVQDEAKYRRAALAWLKEKCRASGFTIVR